RAAGAGVSLPGKADLLAFLEPGGQLDLKGLAGAQGEALRLKPGGFLKRDFQRVFVIAALGPGRGAGFSPAKAAAPEAAAPETTAAPPRAAAEELGENVHRVAIKGEAAAVAAARAAAAALPCALERGARRAVGADLAPVEPGALVGIAQNRIGRRDFLETLRRLRVIRVPVGVQVFCQFAIGFLDLGIAAAARHPKHAVRISCHRCFLVSTAVAI